MNSVVQSEIFFFITSVAVVIGGILLCILLIYVILIFRDIRAISKSVKRETELISMDIDAARDHIRKNGLELKSILGFFRGLWDLGKRKRKQR